MPKRKQSYKAATYDYITEGQAAIAQIALDAQILSNRFPEDEELHALCTHTQALAVQAVQKLDTLLPYYR